MNDFRKKVLGVHNKRTYTVKNSVGIYDIFKNIRRNQWKEIGFSVTQHQFHRIIRTINKALCKDLLEGKDITLPYWMGTIEVRKYDSFKKFKDGKLVTNLPIDWDKTLELWEKDEEAYKERTLVKAEEKQIYKILYNRGNAKYTNKAYYVFSFNRYLKRNLTKEIKHNNFDAFML